MIKKIVNYFSFADKENKNVMKLIFSEIYNDEPLKKGRQIVWAGSSHQGPRHLDFSRRQSTHTETNKNTSQNYTSFPLFDFT